MDYLTPIMTVGLSSISALIGWKIAKPRLFAAIRQELNDYLTEMFADAVEHPEKLQPFVDVMIKQGMKTLGIDKAMSPGKVEVGPLKVSGGALQVLMPLVQRFMGRFAEKGVEEAVSAFG